MFHPISTSTKTTHRPNSVETSGGLSLVGAYLDLFFFLENSQPLSELDALRRHRQESIFSISPPSTRTTQQRRPADVRENRVLQVLLPEAPWRKHGDDRVRQLSNALFLAASGSVR